MQILHTVEELRDWSRGMRCAGEGLIALVPTMGALHAGHASLIHSAVQQSPGRVAVSIFVNPTQFGPNEDFARYPRTFSADCDLAEREGATVIFAPAVEEMYPPGAVTFVDVESLSERLDGKSRPGHFRGVATVVTKLLIAAEPDLAFFGQKDAAQVAILRKLVTDLRLGTKLVVCPIVREADGLAMSSRNRYLTPEERQQALALSQAVQTVVRLANEGERRSNVLIDAAREIFSKKPMVQVDYIELVNWETLLPLNTADHGSLFAVAASVGNTRLIDNTILQ
jgi:pantoate--beta-alanine ligase